MARIDLCFVWHMHQPFYKDLVSGEYKLPWTRMHGLKDYYGMVKVLEEFPNIHQTFNLVPSMMVQLEEYAAGEAADPFLRAALKPAEDLTESEQRFILQYFFQANVSQMIYRYPRYAELYERQQQNRQFIAQDFRDLQVLSQLAWFDEIFLAGDKDVAALVNKQRGYSLADQALMGAKQLEILGHVLPVYSEFAASGQIEISTTPYYHPILPLLCDSDIAGISHPHVPLPSRFRYPEDARHQLETARHYMQNQLGIAPAGLWPSEGSVSDEALSIAASLGFKWFATDNGVLARTIGREAGAPETYRPYLWRCKNQEMHGIFRDHYLSDLVGFTYSRMGAVEAAEHFLHRIRENCGGRDALVPVILDGENAWEYFENGGREFLRRLYAGIEKDPKMRALTVSEALRDHEPTVIEGIFPGSWISANFDVWIGAEEDNRAWEYLLRARQTYDQFAAGVDAENRKLAFEELLIAEGSDWCWWYGPEHDSANRPEFDQLFRDHLANVYRCLNQSTPEELSRPILKISVAEFHQPPSTHIHPVVDGEISSYFEWMGAGEYRIDQRQGAMHGGRSGLNMCYYGTDGSFLYLRFDFDPMPELPLFEVRVKSRRGEIVLNRDSFAALKVLEASVSLSALGYKTGELVEFQASLWQSGLPLEALPHTGWLALDSSNPGEWR